MPEKEESDVSDRRDRICYYSGTRTALLKGLPYAYSNMNEYYTAISSLISSSLVISNVVLSLNLAISASSLFISS